MENDFLTIALPKGRLGEDALKILKDIGYNDVVNPQSRKLIFIDSIHHLRYMIVKPVDVITYVEQGVADIGFIGLDSILESRPNVYELLDLDFGHCTFSICGAKGANIENTDVVLKVATKYPNITKQFFKDREQKIEIIKLNGSVELAPLVGLSDVIADIVETGKTLKANGLEMIEIMHDISAKLISNRASYRFKYEKIKTTLSEVRRKECDLICVSSISKIKKR
jgi:ATP phosphoribosyltransferase